MIVSSTETATRRSPGPTAAEASRIRRLRAAPLGPYDPDVQAMLLPLRNAPAAAKLALLRVPDPPSWALVRLGGRGRAVEVLPPRWSSLAEAEWAVFRLRWQALHGWDPECVGD
jgi:hypothetical protein